MTQEAKIKLRGMRIEILKRTHGIDVHEMSSDEWLNLAIETEDTVKAVGPMDPAAPYFYQKIQDYMNAARIKEELENEAKVVA